MHERLLHLVRFDVVTELVFVSLANAMPLVVLIRIDPAEHHRFRAGGEHPALGQRFVAVVVGDRFVDPMNRARPSRCLALFGEMRHRFQEVELLVVLVRGLLDEIIVLQFLMRPVDVVVTNGFSLLFGDLCGFLQQADRPSCAATSVLIYFRSTPVMVFVSYAPAEGAFSARMRTILRVRATYTGENTPPSLRGCL